MPVSPLSRSFQHLEETCPEESLRTTVLTQMGSLPECRMLGLLPGTRHLAAGPACSGEGVQVCTHT